MSGVVVACDVGALSDLGEEKRDSVMIQRLCSTDALAFRERAKVEGWALVFGSRGVREGRSRLCDAAGHLRSVDRCESQQEEPLKHTLRDGNARR